MEWKNGKGSTVRVKCIGMDDSKLQQTHNFHTVRFKRVALKSESERIRANRSESDTQIVTDFENSKNFGFLMQN